MLIGLIGLGRPGNTRQNLAHITGALLPVLSAILLVAWTLHVQECSPGEAFGTLYWSPAWQAVFAPTHSFLV